MGDSFRIRTELGINKTINVELEQNFNNLEILSLQIQQEDLYNQSCANYGVVIGRITANNGFGIPNAKVSVFVPIQEQDLDRPEITAIYPYKTPDQKNEDGYRYNLLPYEASYSGHTPTGTFPSLHDVLVDKTAIEIYDKYYKYTVKTNESGDYMIMGVPLGVQVVFLDIDLSDIGEFSLSPQDLIRMGRATEAQLSGKFKSSENLNSLPQILSLTKSIDVSPLWGDPTTCQIAINRVDFDLRDDANIDIQPTSVFMGSMFSASEKYRIRKNAKPRDDMGNLCGLQAGPGQILAIRHTINLDAQGLPILEEYKLEQNGNIIDSSGVWLTELPMNLDYVVTNEFGEKVFSNDPKVGIPTKARYRFKIKWSQPSSLSLQVRRPYYLVPNVREYGWSNSTQDPNVNGGTQTQLNKLAGSYYFGLDWSGYTNVNAALTCEDTFYEFDYNRVYTVSALIDQFKNGGRGRFIGIKEIDDDACAATVNKFPVNEGFRNFDLLYFLFAIIFQVVQYIGVPFLIILHAIAWVWNNFRDILIWALIAWFTKDAVQNTILAIQMAIAATGSFGATLGAIAPFIIKALLNGAAATTLIKLRDKMKNFVFKRFKLPMIQYPDCEACECEKDSDNPEVSTNQDQAPPSGLLSQLSNPTLYIDGIIKQQKTLPWPFDNNIPVSDREDFYSILGTMKSIAVAGNGGNTSNPYSFKINSSYNQRFPYPSGPTVAQFSYGVSLPPGERINIYNTRQKYFTGENKIRVTFDAPNNSGKKHFDNTITVLATQDLPAGTLLSFVSPQNSTDPNFLWTGVTSGRTTLYGIEGTANTGPQTIQVSYATSQTTNSSVPGGYFISTGTTNQRTSYAGDIEYYQVITAITITKNVVNNNTVYTNPNFYGTAGFWGALNFVNRINTMDEVNPGWILFPDPRHSFEAIPTSTFTDFEQQKVMILQRGVDPYSPKVINEYGIGKILGYANEDDVIITASTRINLPIQALPSTLKSVQDHTQNSQILFGSNFFTPGTPNQPFSSYTTSNTNYYGALDKDSPISLSQGTGLNFNLNGPILGRQTNSSAWTIRDDGGFNVNRYYSAAVSNGYYGNGEDISGAGLMSGDLYPQTYRDYSFYCNSYYSVNIGGTCYTRFVGTPWGVYYSPNLKNRFNITITQPNVVMRTDRLPSSDYSDNTVDGFDKNTSLLQQNLGFAVYNLDSGEGFGVTSQSFSTGADQVTADIEGQYAMTNVLDTMNTCENMVSLDCYQGNGYSFGVKPNCADTDNIEKGCYVFLTKPIATLGKDIKAWAEWGFRFRFFYGLCRGVLSQSFTNNWLNGGLYFFPIQVNTKYNNLNQPSPPEFAKELIYFDSATNNFYYRSSPYLSGSTQPFIGRPKSGLVRSVNDRNLLFPTTIMNLGMKDSFYGQVILEPSAKAYVMSDLDVTSYSDTSDLVNLFVITRLTDEGFLQQLFAVTNNNGLNQLFSRRGLERRIDADLAQSMSINSEFGVIPFSPEFYQVFNQPTDPVVVLGSLNLPTMGIFFSSTTQDLQNKDYLTPGVLNFRSPINPNAITYPYGIKTQTVPFYQWRLHDSSRIFGDENNDWSTGTSDIFSRGYQSQDRRNQTMPSYFIGSNALQSDVFARGYIFNVDSFGNYSTSSPIFPSKFAVGAPFHFYFGLIKGETALDKFKTKYGINE